MNAAAVHVRWPASRFYWAILDTPGWSRIGEVPPGVLAALDEELPVAAHELHAVCAPGASGVVVCAARRAELDALGPEVLSLTPEALPTLGAQALDSSLLNLLVGAYEPLPVRRAALRSHLAGATMVLACTVLLGVGLLRRESAWRVQTTAAQDATASILAAALPESGRGLDLAAELDRLRRAQAAATFNTGPSDAALMLASVLAAWPSRTACATNALTVGQDGASLSVVTPGDPTEFIESLRPPTGWTLDEPRLNASERGTRLSLRLRPPQRRDP